MTDMESIDFSGGAHSEKTQIEKGKSRPVPCGFRFTAKRRDRLRLARRMFRA